MYRIGTIRVHMCLFFAEYEIENALSGGDAGGNLTSPNGLARMCTAEELVVFGLDQLPARLNDFQVTLRGLATAIHFHQMTKPLSTCREISWSPFL